MAYPDIATKEDLAKELTDCAREAEALEELLRYMDAVLVAVNNTDLLDRNPDDNLAAEKLSAGITLLSDLQRKLSDHEARPGTDLSISLRVLSTDVNKGRFAHKRELEPLQ